MSNGVFAVALPSLLVWSAIADLRSRRIPNLACGLIALSWFFYTALVSGFPTILGSLVGGSGIFVVCFLLWKMNLLGGGDVKLLSALALWANVTLLAPLLLITAISGGMLCVVWMFVRRARSFMPTGLAGVLSGVGLPTLPDDDRGLPYGVAISLAGLWLSHRLLWS